MPTLIALTNAELTRFFFAIVLLLLFAHLGAYIFQRYKLPKVIGEIVAGVLLGSTVLGFFAPEAYTWIFSGFPSEGKLISLFSWMGLILLMFISGFELNRKIEVKDKKTIGFLIGFSTIIPCIIGFLLPRFTDLSGLLGVKHNPLAFALIFGIAMAVTSIPVISRIFLDLKIIHTRFARVVLSIAAIKDIVLWTLLAVATGLVETETASIQSMATSVVITMLFFGVALFVMPKLIRATHSWRANLLFKSSGSGYALLICFFFAALASLLQVNIVFGAFLAGIIVGTFPDEKFVLVKDHIKDIGRAFFIPIYFAIVGLKLNLLHHFDLSLFIWFLLLSSLIQMTCSFIAAKLAHHPWHTSLNLGVAMNTRGGPGIVLASIAFELGIIHETLFSTLVLVSIVTSFVAGVWFRFMLAKKGELMAE